MERDDSDVQPDNAPAKIPNDQTPLARVLAHEAAYWTSVAAAEPRPGWTLFHNAALLGRIDPNHAGDFRAAEGTGADVIREVVAFTRRLAPARPPTWTRWPPPVTWYPAFSTPAFASGTARQVT